MVIAALSNSMLNQSMGEWTVRQFHGPHTMSFLAALVAMAGMVLGSLGLVLGWKTGERVSFVSALGFLACYMALLIALILALDHESAL